MKYIVYVTINLINFKYSIGVHGVVDENKFDGYIGCGVYITKPATYIHEETTFKKAVKKYGVNNFKRITLSVFNNEQDAYNLEKKLVNKNLLKLKTIYNMAIGGRDTTLANKRVPIYMYDLDGNYQKEFKSLIDAARFLNKNCKGAGHLTRAIKNNHQFLGHRFSYVKVKKLNKAKHRKINKIEKPYSGLKVGKYDDFGNLLKIYNNMTSCVKDGYKNAKLVAEGKRSHCNGYVFKYIN